MNPDDFRKYMRCFPAAVSVVTTSHKGQRYGLTASAITSLSLEPPCILVCVNKDSQSHDMIKQSKLFCMNLLHVGQSKLSNQFGGIDIDETDNPFDYADFDQLKTGAPAMTDALMNLDCVLKEFQTMSTHTIFIGEVVEARKNNDYEPLLYLNKAYGQYIPLKDE